MVVNTKLLIICIKSTFLQVGLDCLHHLPGVGSNLQDHLEMSEPTFFLRFVAKHNKIPQVRGSAMFPACQSSWWPEGAPHDQGHQSIHPSWVLESGTWFTSNLTVWTWSKVWICLNRRQNSSCPLPGWRWVVSSENRGSCYCTSRGISCQQKNPEF